MDSESWERVECVNGVRVEYVIGERVECESRERVEWGESGL